MEDGALLEVKGNEATTAGRRRLPAGGRVEPHRQGQRNARSVGRKYRPTRWRAVSPFGGHRRSGRRGASRGQGQRGHNSGRRRLPAGRRVEPHRQGQRNARFVGRKHRPIGGGLFPNSGATVAVEDGALLEVKGNEATTQGGGVYLQAAGSSLTAKGNGTRVLLEGNTAPSVAGCVPDWGPPSQWKTGRFSRSRATRPQLRAAASTCRRPGRASPPRATERAFCWKETPPHRWRAVSQLGATVAVEDGALLEVKGNEATTRGGGVYLQDAGSSLTAKGNGTRVLLEGNTAPIGGGLCPNSGATVAVEDGALLEVKGNEATTAGRRRLPAGRPGRASPPRATERAFCWKETPPHRWRAVSQSGATVAVEDGALLEVKGNEATTQGGGVYLQDAGSSLTAKGNGTRVLLEGNTAPVGGGLCPIRGPPSQWKTGRFSRSRATRPQLRAAASTCRTPGRASPPRATERAFCWKETPPHGGGLYPIRGPPSQWKTGRFSRSRATRPQLGRRRLPAGRRVEPHRQGQRNARSVGRKHRPIGGGLCPRSGATVAVEDGALLEVKGNEATTRGRRRLPAGRRVEPHRQGQRNARSVGRKHRPTRWRAVS